MSETKFTPGPWKAGVDELGAPYVEAGNGNILYMDSKTGVEDYANAALIAAAPDMYKMLKRFATYFKERGFNTPRTCTLPTPEDVCNLIDEIERKEIFR